MENRKGCNRKGEDVEDLELLACLADTGMSYAVGNARRLVRKRAQGDSQSRVREQGMRTDVA